MKKILFSIAACLTVASSAFAGYEMASPSSKDGKTPMVPEPCFRDHEFQLDVFGSYTNTEPSGYSDGFGGGLGVNYFFTRMLGFGVDGNVFEGNQNGVWNTTASFIVRFPIENGTCIAPYLFSGGGWQVDGTSSGTLHGGGGLEWRASHSFGVYSEGRYTWAPDDNDSVQARLGVRFVF